MTVISEPAWLSDPHKCTGCGDCLLICPVGALKIAHRQAVMQDQKSCCRESCRICEYHCSQNAITAY